MRISALIKRIRQQLLRDKRTLALLFVAPLLILTLMYFLFNGNSVPLKLGVVGIDEGIVEQLQNVDIDAQSYKSGNENTVIKDKLDGLLKLEDEQLTLTLLNEDPSRSKQLTLKVNQAVSQLLNGGGVVKEGRVYKLAPNNLGQSNVQPNIEISYIYGDEETVFFDIFSTILVAFFVFFFVFLISGIGLLRERTTGTLERLMSTPIRRGEVLTGYLAGYGIFAIFQTLIVVFFAIYALDIQLVGSIWNVLLVNLLMALVALSLGILLSTFASSEFQMVQFIPVVIIPQIFFAGIFPMESMASWLQWIGRIMPLYYGADAMKGVMYKGWGFHDIVFDVLILVLFAAIFITLNMFALKKYRK